MTINTLISVITVSYNAVETIEKTILSVINQIYANVEYIIIDGGSTDGTVDVINKYSERIFYWISESDKGIYDAMNKGVAKANGDYLFFLGADDALYSKFTFWKVSQYFKQKNIIYYGKVLLVPSRKIYGEKMNLRKICLKNINHQAIFYPRKVFEKYNYNTLYKVYADYHLNLLCFSDEIFSFTYLDCIVSEFNEQGYSSNVVDVEFNKVFFSLIRKRFGIFLSIYSRVCLFVYNLKRNSGTY